VAKTPDGERTRVRVGPFASRAEADKAAGKIKGLSLPAAVLSL
jgi:DedD protein